MFKSITTNTTPAVHPRTRSSSDPGIKLRHITNIPPSHFSPAKTPRATSRIDCFSAGQERTVHHSSDPACTLASLNIEQFIRATKDYLNTNPNIELHLYNEAEIKDFISYIKNVENYLRLKHLKQLSIPIVTWPEATEIQELINIITSKAELFSNLTIRL